MTNGEARHLVATGERLMVAGAQAAEMCGLSLRTWRKMDNQALVPRAIRCGRRKLWGVDELREWVAAGAPTREEWESMRTGVTR